MAVIHEAIRTILTGTSAVTDLVSTRIYPQEVAQGVAQGAAYVVYDEDDVDLPYALNVESGGEWREYSFECWAQTVSAARAIAEAITNALSNYNGVASGITIHRVFKSGGGTLALPDNQGAADTINGVEVNFIVVYAN